MAEERASNWILTGSLEKLRIKFERGFYVRTIDKADADLLRERLALRTAAAGA